MGTVYNPVGETVIVEDCVRKDVTKNGIYLPESHKESGLRYGVVQSVGPGIYNTSSKVHSRIAIENGDTIAFTSSIELGEKLRVVEWRHIIVVRREQ